MKKYSKQLKSVLLDYSKKKIQEPDEDSGDTPEWDEVVVNNFKIQKIHVTPEFSPDFAEDRDIHGFSFELYHETEEMVDYINRKVQPIKT